MPTQTSNAKKTKFPILATLVAFTVIVIMLVLGFWQLERKTEKDIRIANIALAANSETIRLADIVNELNEYQDYIVFGEGSVGREIFYIDNKLRKGQPGFHVLVPFTTEKGIFMLNLGWVAAKGIRADLPEVLIPRLTSVKGILYLPLKNSLVTETNNTYGNFPVLLQQVDIKEISRHLGQDVLPATIRLLPDETSFVREWEVITMSPEKHLAYAVQWFGLAIAALTIYLLSMLKWMHGPKPILSTADTHK